MDKIFQKVLESFPGGALGGLVGGLIGFYLGSQAEDEVCRKGGTLTFSTACTAALGSPARYAALGAALGAIAFALGLAAYKAYERSQGSSAS